MAKSNKTKQLTSIELSHIMAVVFHMDGILRFI